MKPQKTFRTKTYKQKRAKKIADKAIWHRLADVIRFAGYRAKQVEN